MDQFRSTWRKTPRTARRVIVLIVGIIIIIGGIFMLVLPGPGWATIFLGLAVIASEFERAERLRAAIVRRFKNVIAKARPSSKR
jgi:uncharacterized protein (TIGR02611 family)